MNKYRLISQFVAINLTGLGFLILAWFNGWFARVIEADSSHVSVVIVALFVFALISASQRVLSISTELDRLRCKASTSARLADYRLALKNSSSASRHTARVVSQISSGSCSTHPSRG